MYRVVEMIPDGACLFRALSYHVFDGDQDRHMEVRISIIRHVVEHWADFQVLTHDRKGDNYINALSYARDMIHSSCMGGLSELIAAGDVYSDYKFVVHIGDNRDVYVSTRGRPESRIKRLLFSGGDMTSGHFDVLLS